MFLPRMRPMSQYQVTVSHFEGYDRRERPGAGGFAGMENLCADAFPALAVRKKRGLVTTLAQPQALGCKEGLVWVDGGRLSINGRAVGPVLTGGSKQLVSMGAYLLLWPDKVWINTRNLEEFGSLENTVVTEGEVTASLCRGDGTAWEGVLASAGAPQEPEAGALWLDTSGQAPVLRQLVDDAWLEVEDVCVKLSCGGIGAGFRAGDGVEIQGCRYGALNGQAVLRSVENGAVVIPGCIDGERRQTEAVTIRRAVPEMDFVVECGNRLWGCKYGVVNGRAVNEIYASKLGDFRNWQCYAGLSTDSYAVSRGADGPFTGAASYLGSPIFFREQSMERVYPSAGGGHRVVTVACPGVKQGSAKSLCVVDGTLYYQGLGGVYAFDGSMPRPVSEALDGMELSGAVGGGREGRYYLSGESRAGWVLLVLDTRRGCWYREDGLRALDFARRGETLFCLDAAGQLWDLDGGEGEAEAAVCWEAESGDLGLDSPAHKYPQRLRLRLALEAGSRAEAWLSYDGGRSWESQGKVWGAGGVQEGILHLRPRRAAQVRWKLRGRGSCVLYSVSAVYGKGSDEA